MSMAIAVCRLIICALFCVFFSNMSAAQDPQATLDSYLYRSNEIQKLNKLITQVEKNGSPLHPLYQHRYAQGFGQLEAHYKGGGIFYDRLKYPYRTVGKLIAYRPNNKFGLCTATVVAPRLILTAGHCVHMGSKGNNGFLAKKFAFIPAFGDQQKKAPYGIWLASSWITTETWSQSKYRVPNDADLAILEIHDGPAYPVTQTKKRIGDFIAGITPVSFSDPSNLNMMLGYPSNLYAGKRMYWLKSKIVAVEPNSRNSFLFGSNMYKGASGGPLIQNSGKGKATGVISYVKGDNIMGAVGLNSPEFRRIYRFMCARRHRNCQ